MKQDNHSSPAGDRAREHQQVKAETKSITKRYEDGDFIHVYPAGINCETMWPAMKQRACKEWIRDLPFGR
jgi:hypothetical protein